MPDAPIAYHITFGTYGARLHGDERPTVDRNHNQFGMPFVEADEARRGRAESLLKSEAVTLTNEERLMIESSAESVCATFGWTYYVSAAQCDHVHIVVSFDAEPKTGRRLIKRELSNLLNRIRRPVRWCAKGGSIKWIWDHRYLSAAYEYVERQRTTASPSSTPRGRGGSANELSPGQRGGSEIENSWDERHGNKSTTRE